MKKLIDQGAYVFEATEEHPPSYRNAPSPLVQAVMEARGRRYIKVSCPPEEQDRLATSVRQTVKRLIGHGRGQHFKRDGDVLWIWLDSDKVEPIKRKPGRPARNLAG